MKAAAEDYGVEFAPGAHRRNVTTREVALNNLIDTRFHVGGTVLEGIGLCEPCGYMQSLADQPDAATALTHRGGLNAQIIEPRTISTEDDVLW